MSYEFGLWGKEKQNKLILLAGIPNHITQILISGYDLILRLFINYNELLACFTSYVKNNLLFQISLLQNQE